ncbi:glycine cleavage system aminomethyltransferase GcvT [Picrophilus oshimae]|uniref:aminomethyltransferase n=1 Tax=Picrophilus torridus (strain ATCC 700027 / DSM 9790 / JCM 10055 / NBRC 100828 / KAW 2/3) TaxID=1122961 RepID=A0A8G2FW62_PICTO|nr:glycine cleavage system aminomethyltransferase GcvT [Picrophilus oshimae]SMD30605.1 aminomethyltransferase [Picrophilus oshimae DSM 9789]
METKNGNRTALYDEHIKLNAKMIDFHGWEMPLEYTGIIDEHLAVRNHVGIFDVSHMGDIVIKGDDAAAFCDYIFPGKVSDMKNGQCMYTAFLNKDGRIIDDTIIYRLSEKRFFFIPNAANIDRIYNWVNSNKNDYNVEIKNYSYNISHIAIQGPDSLKILDEMKIKYPGEFKFNYHNTESYNDVSEDNSIIVSGTGYTGEIGVEIIVPNKDATILWEDLIKKIKDYYGKPCGLGSRDTLRMEKGMLLSGQDFNEDRTPYEASISFIINYNHDFIGKEALIKNRNEYNEIFRGFILNGRNIPRQNCDIIYNNEVVGIISSGSYSPSLNRGIGLGYIKKDIKIKTTVKIKIREKLFDAEVSRPKMLK